MSSEKFDAKSIDLSGKNLIEASAGTGKTYSIGILALRLIIEKNIPINQILMVTFTNTAVAELEDRIRKFIRVAYKIKRGEVIDLEYNEIYNILERIRNQKIVDDDKVLERLSNAIQLLDETSIQTIHSFCQDTLKEYAFETNQMYDTKLLTNIDDVILDSLKDFWRNEITRIDIKFLEMINIKMDDLISVVRKALADKKFVGQKICDVNDIDKLYGSVLSIKNDFITHFNAKENWSEHLDSCLKIDGVGQATISNWKEYVKDVEVFWDNLRDTSTNRKFLEEEVAFKRNFDNQIVKSINTIYYRVIDKVSKKVKEYLSQNKLMSQDDLITNLHKAVSLKENTKLITSLRDKYQAVFIDEFQDTDRNQYDIFNTVFGEGVSNSILFYIGDPKQSIYAWRKADINTYFNAKSDCNLKVMNRNYRSSNNYVRAMNEFFTAIDDPFYFKINNSLDSVNAINYESVYSEKEDSTLVVGDEDIKPMTIYKDTALQDISLHTANGILQLLKNGLLNGKKINPSNIAVLVRKKAEGKDVKLKLESLGIPAITMDDSKVFKSDEAKNIGYILETVIDLSWKKINKALLNNFTGKSVPDLLKLNKKSEVDNFKKYEEIWTNNGVYSMLLEYASDYNVQDVLAKLSGGERIISNFYQIAEILQKQEVENKYSKTEIYRFLRRKIDGLDDQNDEYLQRIESDEQAVKIITIHKSKGLEFDIVFAPFLDFTLKNNWKFLEYRGNNNDYVFALKKQMSDDEISTWEQQNEQENRRLLYVAITRAKYNCFLFKNGENSITSLTPFFSNLTEEGSKLQYIEIKDFNGEIGLNEKFSITEKQTIKVSRDVPKDLKLEDRHWRKMSYSYLSGHHAYSTKELKMDSYNKGSYDQFIFKDLPKGAHVGNLLHNIFEFIDFTEQDNSRWKDIVEVSLKRFLPNPDFKEPFTEKFLEMIKIVLNTTIKVGEEQFKLSNVPNTNKITELEFNFITDTFNVAHLSTLEEYLPKAKRFEISTKKDECIEGMLHGFIDLFFECNGRYYILDWKSNFLGDIVKDYSSEKLVNAMNDSNYHLQYIIYTLAIKKYLSSKMNTFNYNNHFGGVIYLFLRGIRQNQKTGIFTYKPDIKVVNALDNILLS